PPALGRRTLGEADHLTGFLDGDDHLLGGEDAHVREGTREYRAGLMILGLGVLGVLQGCSEGTGGHRTPRTGRSGDQPGMRHRSRIGHRSAERGHGLVLSDQRTPYTHRSSLWVVPSGAWYDPPIPAPPSAGRSAATRSRIRDCTVCTGWEASSTSQRCGSAAARSRKACRVRWWNDDPARSTRSGSPP